MAGDTRFSTLIACALASGVVTVDVGVMGPPFVLVTVAVLTIRVPFG